MSEAIVIEGRDAKGTALTPREISSDVFAANYSAALVHQVVRWQRARKRAGTHNVLTRGQMKGGGAKPWRQKGTGRARAGSRNSPIWVGGGVAHGPKQRSYEFSVNKKERQAALKGVISERHREGKFLFLDSFAFEGIKTREAVKVLQALGLTSGTKVLVVVPKGDEQLVKSLRNISGVKPIYAAGLNVYDVLYSEYLLVVGDALGEIEGRFEK